MDLREIEKVMDFGPVKIPGMTGISLHIQSGALRVVVDWRSWWSSAEAYYYREVMCQRGGGIGSWVVCKGSASGSENETRRGTTLNFLNDCRKAREHSLRSRFGPFGKTGLLYSERSSRGQI